MFLLLITTSITTGIGYYLGLHNTPQHELLWAFFGFLIGLFLNMGKGSTGGYDAFDYFDGRD